MNFQQGAFGPPTELTALVRFWTIMEQLHYPTAKQIKDDLQQELEQQREAQQLQAQMGQTNLSGTAQTGTPFAAEGGIPSAL